MNPRVNDVRRLIELCQDGSMKIFSGIRKQDFSFAPSEEMMTLTGQIDHISLVQRQFLRKISETLDLNLNIPEKKPFNNIEGEIKSLEETWALTDSLLNRLDDSMLDQPVPVDEPDREIDVHYILLALVEHLVHHRGEIVVYFRIMGRRPPRRYLDDDPK